MNDSVLRLKWSRLVQILNCEFSRKLEQEYDDNMNKKLRVRDLTGLLALAAGEKKI